MARYCCSGQTLESSAANHPIRDGRRLTWLCILLCCATAHAQPQSDQEEVVLNPSSYPEHLHVHGDALYFAADDGIHGREVWRYTPEKENQEKPECCLVTDLVPGQDASDPAMFFSSGDCLYLAARVPLGQHRAFLLEKDGRATQITAPDTLLKDPYFLAQNPNAIYISATNAQETRTVCRVAPGAVRAEIKQYIGTNLPREVPRCAMGNDASLYYYFSHYLIRIKDDDRVILGNLTDATDLFITGAIAPLGNGIIFVGYDEAHGRELWRTDGTPKGTTMLKDIAEGQNSSRITGFCEWENELYFGADNGKCGKELWKTDGTTEGTILIMDHFEGPSDGDPHYFGPGQKWLFYLAHDGAHGKELWRTDGTSQNTVMVADLRPGPLGSNAWQLTPFKNELYFCADSPRYGEEIFISDGTPAGTRILKDIAPGKRNSGPDNLTVLGDRLFFTCDDGIHGEELWMTDGSSEGTRLAADIHPIRINPSSSPRNLVALGERIFFTAHHQTTGEELWVSDGTSEGTRLVRDIAPGREDGSPSEMTALGDHLLFVARTAEHGRELWSSDGTPEGTYMVRDIKKGPEGSHPSLFCSAGDKLFFAAANADNREMLWQYDNADTSVREIGGLEANEDAWRIDDVFSQFDNIYVYVRHADNKGALWRIATANDELALVPEVRFPSHSGGPAEISANVNMTEAELATLIYPPGFECLACRVLKPGGTLLSVVPSCEFGAELFQVYQAPPSLQLLRDIFPGPASSSPSHLCQGGELVYFTAEHPTEGRVLWKTDGTAEGTGFVVGQAESVVSYTIPAYELAALDKTLVVVSEPARPLVRAHKDIELRFIALNEPIEDDVILNIRVGEQGSRPHQLTRAGNKVFFTADDGIHGEELWVTDGTPQGTHLVTDIMVPGDLSPMVP